MNHGCFITATDTGVGKTAITAALGYHLCERGVAVGVMKPVETGVPVEEDAQSDAARLRAAAGATDPMELISPYRFPEPLAPLAAARRTGKAIELDRIVRAFERLGGRSRPMLVEGIGGLLAPLSETFELADLIRALKLPAIVVGRAGLGGINHALLTVEALARRNIPVLAVALNCPTPAACSSSDPIAFHQVQTTVDLVRELGGRPVYGPIGHVPRLCEDWINGVAQLSHDPAIKELASLILSSGR